MLNKIKKLYFVIKVAFHVLCLGLIGLFGYGVYANNVTFTDGYDFIKSNIVQAEKLDSEQAKEQALKQEQKTPIKIVKEVSEAYNVNPVEIVAVITVENRGWDTEAINFNYGSNSLKTADIGLMQVNARTAKTKGYSVVEALNPSINVEIGTNHWANCKDSEAGHSKSEDELIQNAGSCYNGGQSWRKNAPEMKAKNINHGKMILAEFKKAKIIYDVLRG